jgi:hypothetical protein
MRRLAQTRNPYSRWWLWIPGFAMPRNDALKQRFSEHSSRRSETLLRPLITREGEIMERREFLKLGLGVVAGATALAASANAAPLPPIRATQGLAPPRSDGAEPALVTKSEVDHLKPEQVRWGRWHGHWHRHWHRRHWGWRRWHHRHWHHRHWRHRWHRHYW